MADSAQIRNDLTALIQGNLSTQLKNTLFNRMPLVYFLFGKDGDKDGPNGLGRPKTGMFLSGVTTAKAKKQTVLSSREYYPIIQNEYPDINDGKVATMYDTMPTRGDWTNKSPASYFTRPRVKWVERIDPYKVPNKEIRVTTSAAKDEQNAWQAVGSLFNAETTSVLAVHLNWWNQSLWGTTGTGSPTSEDATVWDSLHSIKSALKADNTYCGVDRTASANAYWQGNYDTTTRTADFETLINYVNYDLGLSKKGGGIDLMLVGAANFKKAKREAKAKGGLIVNNGGIPDFGKFGFQRELVKIDNTWIVYDPECPATEVAALNLDTWTFAIHPDANFKVTKPFDQSQIEGGDDAQAGVVRTEIMLVCEVPSFNAYFTAVS